MKSVKFVVPAGILVAFAVATAEVGRVVPASTAPAGGAPSSLSTPLLAPPINVGALQAEKTLRPGRDLFRFAAAPVGPVPAGRPSAVATLRASDELQGRPVPAAPISGLTLIGIAAQRSPTGLDRTAILVDAAGTLQMGQVGEVLGGRYEVLLVGTDCAEMKDLTTMDVQRVRLSGSTGHGRGCERADDR